MLNEFSFFKNRNFNFCIFKLRHFFGCAEKASQMEIDLQSEQNILEQQRIAIQEIKSQIKNRENQTNLTLPATAVSNQSEIANLSDYIQRLKDSHNLTSEASTTEINGQREQAHLTKVQLLPAYETLKQNIPRTEEQITLLTSLTLRNKEQDLLLENLRNQALTERQQMAYLQDQMAQIDANLLRNLALISSITQEQKREIASAVDEAQEEIMSRRDYINTLQATNNQIKIDLTQLNQQLQQAENNYANQLKKIQILQSQINTTKKEIE